MSGMVDWIFAAAEDTYGSKAFRPEEIGKHRAEQHQNTFSTISTEKNRAAQHLDTFTAKDSQEVRLQTETRGGDIPVQTVTDKFAGLYRSASWEEERERRIYRGRTVKMLRRYMRYSIETGRLPSLLGREFFRSKVTSYTVVTFEDRVIFVHDMENCLDKLDEFSRQLIARHILQEHDQAATARLIGCGERTVRRYAPIALDMLSEILLDVGLLKRISAKREKSCQEGESDQNSASDCETSKNKF